MSAENAEAPAAGAFSRSTVVAMLVAGIFSFSTLAVLASFAPDLRQGGDPRAHALSKSAVGFGGLVKLLELRGTPVLISRTRTAPGNALALRVLTPDAEAKPTEIRALAAGMTLVVLPKWEIAPDLRNRDWVTRGPPIPAAEIEKGPAASWREPRLARRSRRRHGRAEIGERRAPRPGQDRRAADPVGSRPGADPHRRDRRDRAGKDGSGRSRTQPGCL